MKTYAMLFCLLLAISANSFTAAKAQVNVKDSLALVDLYNNTNGPGWRYHKNWLTTEPVSTWYGVTVTGTHITSLSLNSNKLSGNLPLSIGDLSNLQYLYCYYNQLSGTIPSSIGNLVALNELWLEHNKFSGNIPSSIGNLINLTYLNLCSNRLIGTIPSSISRLAKLNTLALVTNRLMDTIPFFLSKLTNLSGLYLDDNRFTGTIPSFLGNMKNLYWLGLGYNQLSGTIPPSLANLNNLTALYLNHNQLTGAVPSSLKNIISHLDNLNLSGNLLTQDDNVDFLLGNNKLIGNIAANHFTFDGLEYVAKKYPNVYFGSQANITIHQHNDTLSVYAGGTLSNNIYHWENRETAEITTITGDSTFRPGISGLFYVYVYNKVATPLTLQSNVFNLVMPSKKPNNTTLIAKAAQSTTAIQHMRIFPNPATNLLHIQTTGVADIILTNATGKTLFTKTINNTAIINVSAYSSGTYYLQNKTTGETQKIIITH